MVQRKLEADASFLGGGGCREMWRLLNVCAMRPNIEGVYTESHSCHREVGSKVLCCESGEKRDWGLRTVEQWRGAVWGSGCVDATAGMGSREGHGWAITSSTKKGSVGQRQGRMVVWPMAGFFWEVWQRRHRAKTQRMTKMTAYSSGMKERPSREARA